MEVFIISLDQFLYLFVTTKNQKRKEPAIALSAIFASS